MAKCVVWWLSCQYYVMHHKINIRDSRDKNAKLKLSEPPKGTVYSTAPERSFRPPSGVVWSQFCSPAPAVSTPSVEALVALVPFQVPAEAPLLLVVVPVGAPARLRWRRGPIDEFFDRPSASKTPLKDDECTW